MCVSGFLCFAMFLYVLVHQSIGHVVDEVTAWHHCVRLFVGFEVLCFVVVQALLFSVWF